MYTLKYVRYIHELSRKLISVRKFEKTDFSVKIGNGVLKLVEGALFSIKGSERNITTREVIKGLNSFISFVKADHTQ